MAAAQLSRVGSRAAKSVMVYTTSGNASSTQNHMTGQFHSQHLLRSTSTVVVSGDDTNGSGDVPSSPLSAGVDGSWILPRLQRINSHPNVKTATAAASNGAATAAVGTSQTPPTSHSSGAPAAAAAAMYDGVASYFRHMPAITAVEAQTAGAAIFGPAAGVTTDVTRSGDSSPVLVLHSNPRINALAIQASIGMAQRPEVVNAARDEIARLMKNPALMGGALIAAQQPADGAGSGATTPRAINTVAAASGASGVAVVERNLSDCEDEDELDSLRSGSDSGLAVDVLQSNAAVAATAAAAGMRSGIVTPRTPAVAAAAPATAAAVITPKPRPAAAAVERRRMVSSSIVCADGDDVARVASATPTVTAAAAVPAAAAPSQPLPKGEAIPSAAAPTLMTKLLDFITDLFKKSRARNAQSKSTPERKSQSRRRPTAALSGAAVAGAVAVAAGDDATAAAASAPLHAAEPQAAPKAVPLPTAEAAATNATASKSASNSNANATSTFEVVSKLAISVRRHSRRMSRDVKAPAPASAPVQDAITRYGAKAEGGDPDAQYFLSQAYDSGKGLPAGVSQDPKRAFEWAMKAAKQNHVRGMTIIGYYFSKGEGTAIDNKAAMEWSTKAAQAGSHIAAHNLGIRYQNGSCGVAKDLAKAKSYFEFSASKNYAPAIRALGRIDPVGTYAAKAEAGDTECMAALANAYRTGTGVAKDEVKAFALATRAASAGSAAGRCTLGLQYAVGSGTEPNRELAVKWMTAAATAGHGLAHYYLGTWTESGAFGIKPNLMEARKLFTTAVSKGETLAKAPLAKLDLVVANIAKAAKGDAEAAWKVSEHYDEVEKNYPKALEYALIAGKLNHAGAMCWLGVNYSSGKKIAQNLNDGMSWMSKAAAGGSSAAMYNLGIRYENGTGGIAKKDLVKALAWYRNAASKGSALARQAKARFETPPLLQEMAASGDTDCQFLLSNAYDKGNVHPGLSKDPKKAFEWALKSALNGSVQASAVLGFYFNAGEGTTKDFSQAMVWSESAASRGNAIANFNLGVRYEKGSCGQTVNVPKAKAFFIFAASRGHTGAKKAVERLANVQATAYPLKLNLPAAPAPAAKPAAATAASPKAAAAPRPQSAAPIVKKASSGAGPVAAASPTAANSKSPAAKKSDVKSPTAKAAAAAQKDVKSAPAPAAKASAEAPPLTARESSGSESAASPAAVAVPDVKAATPKAAKAPLPAVVYPESASTPNAEASFVSISKEDDHWDTIDTKLKAGINGQHEDYNSKRLKKGLKPITFRLLAADEIQNPALIARFEAKLAEWKAAAAAAIAAAAAGPAQEVVEVEGSAPAPASASQPIMRTGDELKIKWAFHGTRASNLKKIATNGLLPVGHPLNPSQSTDPGFFGAPTHGIYVSRYVDYVAKYSNDLEALEPGDTAKIVMLKVLPGRSVHIPSLSLGMAPTPGYDSHSSPNYLEWFVFDAAQVLPVYVLTIKAIENTRTDADDKHNKA